MVCFVHRIQIQEFPTHRYYAYLQGIFFLDIYLYKRDELTIWR